MEQHHTVFISSWHTAPGAGGIYTYHISPDGEPLFGHFQKLLCAGYLAMDQEKKFLYATCKVNDSTDGAAAFKIEADGSLSKHGEIIESGGLSTCHIAVSQQRKFLYTANYHSGSFSEYRLADDGTVSNRTRIIRHHGHGPNKERQEMAHPHCCVFSPDNRFLAVADLGNDTISCYPFDEVNGIDETNPVVTPMEPGCGPRHILFDPDVPLAYVITELGNSLLSSHFDNGKLEFIDELFLLPRGVRCPTKASALRFSQDKAFIIASNRGFDSLATVELDGKGGLFPVSLSLSGGSSPRDMNFIGENFFAAANEFSDEVRFFDFDVTSGILSPNGFSLEMPRPLCIIQYR